MAAPGMMYCPKCASPLDHTERARLALREETTKSEIAELKGLLEKYFKGPAQKEGSIVGDSGSVKEEARTGEADGRGGMG